MKLTLRRAAELLLGPITLKRRLPAHAGGGLMMVNAEVGGLRYLLKPSALWDPELIKVCNLLVHEKNVVWDIGANIGLFSLTAAAKSGPEGNVYAFEADADAVKLLHASNRLKHSSHAEITVLPMAIFSEVGFLKFSIANRSRSANYVSGFGSTQTGGAKEVRVLPCFNLDFLLDHFPAPEVLKLDVEGAELEVLKGATRMLSEVRPRMYCEVEGVSSAQFTDLMHRYNYSIWDGAVFDETSDSTSCSRAAAYNTVAIPREQVTI